MTRTITATYDSKITLSNVVDDLVNDGLSREMIYRDDAALQIKVMIPETIESEIDLILKRHHPTEMH